MGLAAHVPACRTQRKDRESSELSEWDLAGASPCLPDAEEGPRIKRIERMGLAGASPCLPDAEEGPRIKRIKRIKRMGLAGASPCLPDVSDNLIDPRRSQGMREADSLFAKFAIFAVEKQRGQKRKSLRSQTAHRNPLRHMTDWLDNIPFFCYIFAA